MGGTQQPRAGRVPVAPLHQARRVRGGTRARAPAPCPRLTPLPLPRTCSRADRPRDRRTGGWTPTAPRPRPDGGGSASGGAANPCRLLRAAAAAPAQGDPLFGQRRGARPPARAGGREGGGRRRGARARREPHEARARDAAWRRAPLRQEARWPPGGRRCEECGAPARPAAGGRPGLSPRPSPASPSVGVAAEGPRRASTGPLKCRM